MRRRQDNQQGELLSYGVGFVLALICSLIPYDLVVNQTVKGNGLLATILAFAVAQLLIQITFFLHIGRGPKPKWNLFFFVATVGIVLVVVGGSILIINNLHYNMQPSEQTARLTTGEGIPQVSGIKTGACAEFKTNYVVIVKNDQFQPAHVEASACDSISFRNEDSVQRTLKFGTPAQSLTYSGQREVALPHDYNQTIGLSVTGTWQFFDASQPSVNGSFTVN